MKFQSDVESIFYIDVSKKFPTKVMKNLMYFMEDYKKFSTHYQGWQTGDLNCRFKQFWSDDINSPKGVALDELIESNNWTQLIDQPTNSEPRGKSCVDLIITDQLNLLVDYGIHSSLDNNCHHLIILCLPLPLTKGKIWDYTKADKDEIRQFLINIDWISNFKDLSSEEMLQQFTSTVMGIMSRLSPTK